MGASANLNRQIAGLQGQLTTLLGGGDTRDWADYLARYPGVATEYQQESTRDKKSIANLANLGINSATDFARWHYETMGQGQGFTVNTPDPGPTPEDATQTLIDTLTKGFTDTLTSLTKSNQDAIDKLNTDNADLVKTIHDQGEGYATSQADLLKQIQDQTASSSKSMQDAVNNLLNAGNSNGQMAHKPDYGRALARNRALNGRGLSSTALTGSGGVPLTSLTLGRTQLTGA